MYNNFSQRYGSGSQRPNPSPPSQQRTGNARAASGQSLIENLEDNPRLKNIDPMKLKIINEIKRQSQTKTMEELIPEIMKINKELTRRNINFTKEESALLMEAIEDSLSPTDKKKFQMLKSFL